MNQDILAESNDQSSVENTEYDQQDSEQKKLAEISRMGYRYLKKGELTAAINSFMEILDIEPNNHYALVGIGDACRKKLRFDEAINYYEHCLQFHPHNNYALFGLADAYRQQHQFSRAIDVWEKYLKYDSRNVTVLTRVADAYQKVRNVRQAEKLYAQVLEIEPQNAYALTGLGHLYYHLHNYVRSLEYWHKIYREQNSQPDIRVLTSIGNCYRKQKSFEQGSAYFEEALEREKNNFYALFGLADCFRGMHVLEKSLIYWNRILEENPQNKIILTRAGDAYCQQRKFEKAREYYEKALDIKYDIYAVLGLANVHIYCEEYLEATQSLENLLKNHIQNYRVYIPLMECYVQLDNRLAAVDLLEKFRNLDSIQPHASAKMNVLKQKLGI